jgi:hypothetical protein
VRAHGRDGRSGSYLATEGSGERTDHAERCKLRTRTHRVSQRRTHADACSLKACRPGQPRAARLVSSRGWRPGADGRQRGATESETRCGRSCAAHTHPRPRAERLTLFLSPTCTRVCPAEVFPEHTQARGRRAKKNQTPRGTADAGANTVRHRAHRQRTVHRSQGASAPSAYHARSCLAPVCGGKSRKIWQVYIGLFPFLFT